MVLSIRPLRGQAVGGAGKRVNGAALCDSNLKELVEEEDRGRRPRALALQAAPGPVLGFFSTFGGTAWLPYLWPLLSQLSALLRSLPLSGNDNPSVPPLDRLRLVAVRSEHFTEGSGSQRPSSIKLWAPGPALHGIGLSNGSWVSEQIV